MAKLCVRIGGALGVTALALFLLGFVPFLSAGPTAGAGYVPGTPGFTVNREFKGDRLPIHAALNSSVWQTEFGPQVFGPQVFGSQVFGPQVFGSQVFGSQARARTPHEIPFGCDPAFSPLSSPLLAYVYGRCLS